MELTYKQLYSKYNNAKKCARERGIDWYFTYDTWVAWWGEDIVNRGCRRGQLVMARHGDIGSYHPDNVSKKTSTENLIEAKLSKKRLDLIGHTLSGKEIQTPMGRFASRAAAARAYKMSMCGMSYRIKNHPEQYYYIKETV